MNKILKNKKGMTLTELLAGLLIASIIAISATAILSPVLKSYYQANDLAETNLVLDTIANEMINEFSRATNIIFVEDGVRIISNSGTVYYKEKKVNDGTKDHALLSRGDKLVFELEYYKNKSIAIDYFPVVDGKKGESSLLKKKIESTETTISEEVAEITDDSSKVITQFYMTIDILSDERVMASRDYLIKPLGLEK